MIWRVVATQQGFHNQTLREPGEVFDLLLYPDGSYPPLQRELPKKDEKALRAASTFGRTRVFASSEARSRSLAAASKCSAKFW